MVSCAEKFLRALVRASITSPARAIAASLQHLGFVPVSGTLNVLEGPFPVEQQAIKIEGFQEEGRKVGECKCYRVKLNGIEAAVVRPELSCYPAELIEVIAPVSYGLWGWKMAIRSKWYYFEINALQLAVRVRHHNLA